MQRNSKRVFVTGSSGLLGRAVIEYFRNFYDVHTTYYNNYFPLNKCNFLKADIRNKPELSKIILKIKPNLIIHTAALTEIDYCEAHKKECYDSNVIASKHIAEIAVKLKCKLIHMSTNFVFDGKNGLYKEDDLMNVVNYYSETKVEAEKVVMKSKADFIILRAAIFGWNVQNKKCFPETVISNLRNNVPVKAFIDQFSNPILVNHLAQIMQMLYEKDASGIFHVGCDERLSRFEIANKIADVFSLDKKLILPVKVAGFKQAIQRPQDTSLDISKLKEFLCIRKIPFAEDVEEMRKLKR